MDWVLVLGMVALVALLVLRRRSRAEAVAKANPRTIAPNRRLQELKLLEGAVCVYEEGNTVLKTRLAQVEESQAGVMLALQVLRAEGLSDVKEEKVHLEAPWSSLESSTRLIHARYAHWKLFFDKPLVQKVMELGLAGTDMKTIKRAILEHQMK